MNKNEFLQMLAIDLVGLPQGDVERWLEYYREMLDDRIEDGMSEEEAVASLGKPCEIVKEILSQTSITKLIKNKLTPSHKLRVWEIVLICLGSPIWLSVAISLVAVFLSVYVSLWAGLIGCYAGVLGGLVGGVLGGLGAAVLFAIKGSIPSVLLMLGGGLACFGIFMPLTLCLNKLTVLGVRWSKSFLRLVKSLFVKGGERA